MKQITNHFFAKKASTKNIQRENAILSKTSSFAIKEAYNATRTNLIFSLINEEGCKKIVMSSPAPGDGKTTSCLNLAITFAQTDAKILLIDADLRKPKIHQYLKNKNDVGLSNILGKFCHYKDAINTSKELGLDYITSGPIPPNPAELLSSKTMESVINSLSLEYDYIFLDTPPINVVTDAITMSKFISGIVLVVRQDCTTHDFLQRSMASLEFADMNILGFILNDVDSASRNYKYGKVYGYGYGYGNNNDGGKKEDGFDNR